MVNLIEKIQRDSLDLNSWERAIVWSAISLKGSISSEGVITSTENYPYKNNVRIALRKAVQDGALTATLLIEATLPYYQSFGINNAGQFIPYLKEFYEGDPIYYARPGCSVLADEGTPITTGGDGLPEEPFYVDTLEKYFLWACWEAERELLDPLPDSLLPISIDFFEESTPDPTIKVTVEIPLDYLAYRSNANFICSCLPLGSVISPAGLRQIQWDELTGVPSFSDVATSGNYSDLTNKPTIPSQVTDLTGHENLVKTINNTSPDPQTGNVDLTLNVGSVDWENINNKPNFADVATTGDYSDLGNPPVIPILTWANVTGKPSWADVAFSGDYTDLANKPTIFSGQWIDITGKPTWATVAFSGSYNDLTDKPTIPDGGSGGGGPTFLGKKTVVPPLSVAVPYNYDFDQTGIFNYIGTNGGAASYDNPIASSEIILTGRSGNLTLLDNICDRTLSTDIASAFGTTLKLEFVNYNIRLEKITLYLSLNNTGEAIFDIQGSDDDSTWTTLGTVTITDYTDAWYHVDVTDLNFYKYFRLVEISKTGSASSWSFGEVELYGEISSSNITNGSQTYNLQLSDLNYLIVPDASIGIIHLLPLNTPGLNVGDRFYFFNPHPFEIQGVAASGDTFTSSNSLSILYQGQTAEVVKVSNNEWFAF